MSEAITFETNQSPWWLLLMGGILDVIVGILLLTNPAKTTLALVWVLGLFWFIQGIFTLVAMFVDHSAWGWKLFMGIIGILAGITILRHPVASTVAVPMILVLVLGIQGLIAGVVSLILAFKGGGWRAGILGALSIIFGVILIMNYASLLAVVTLIWVVAVFAIVGGGMEIILAIRQRSD